MMIIEELKIFEEWTESNSDKLEAGFFKHENEDKNFSERISNALYMIEQMK